MRKTRSGCIGVFTCLIPLRGTTVFLLLCICFSKAGFSQNQPMYSQYLLNPLPINPAYAGSQENLSVTAVYRKQWINMDGAPTTETFSAHSPLKKKKIALGFNAFNDKIGVTNRTALYGIYAYRIRFGNKSTLSLGLQGGMERMVSRLSQLQTRLPNDPSMSSDRIIYTVPGFGAGAYWYAPKYFLGFSVPDLLDVRLRKYSDQVIRYRHFFFHGGAVFRISDQLKYMPGFLVKGVQGSHLQFDINQFIIVNDVLWCGISYRSETSLNLVVQMQLTDQLSAGYAYDAPFSRFSSLAGPSHEFKLSYRFVFFKENAFMPRYF